MAIPYKNPNTPIFSEGTTSINPSSTFGNTFSVYNIGGYMEVGSLSDLAYTIPTGTTGSVEYSGNTIPIEFLKGGGQPYSPDVLTLYSDNISSGRRRLGMLVYVHEEDQVYQFHISGYTSLFTAATASTNCVSISEFGTLVRNNTPQGQSFINAWTASTIEDVNGYTSETATWRKFNSGTGGGGSGFTSVRINNVSQFTSNTNSFINFSGVNVSISSVGTNTLVFSAGTGGGGGSSNLQYFITGSTPSGLTINSGDRWFDTNTGVEVVYINDGDSSQWVRPSNGMVPLFTGNTSASCITSLYVSNIYGCSPININDLVIANSGLTTNGLTATTISATTYYNLPSAVFTGGTVTGATNFTGGLTANTISATTYQNLPTDIRTTGGTYSNNTFTFTNNTGGTYSVLFNTITGLTVNGVLTITGNTSAQGLTATTISATTYQNLPSQSGTGVSSLSYVPTTGVLTLTKNDSTTLTAGTFTYLTGSSYSNNILTFTNNLGTASNVTINTLTGLTVNGNLTVTGTTTSGTISATTYQNLPFSGTVGVFGAGGVNFLTRWSTTTDLQDSRLYDDGTFLGLGVSTPTYGETVNLLTNNKGVVIDSLYIIQTSNGSLAFATGNDYSVWGSNGEIAIGTRGPLINSVGSGNIGIGDKALTNNTIGINNIAIGGTGALLNNTGGTDNISIGYNSLNQNSSGGYNISLGTDSLHNNLGGRNVAIGVNAGYTNTSNDKNIYIGTNAGYYNDGSNNIFIGDSAGYGDTTSSDRLIIGDTIYGDLNTKLIGINQANPVTTLDVNGTLRVSSGLTASTISATTYFNLPTDIRVTGATYSNNNFTFTNNTGGTFSVLFNTVTGLTVNGGLSSTTISATTYQNLPFSGTVTGSGTLRYIPSWNSSSSLNDTIIYNATDKIGISTSSPLATLHVSGTTIISSGLTATTISATTYQNLPIKYYAEFSGAPTNSPIVLSTGSISIGDGAESRSTYMLSFGQNSGRNATGTTYSNFIGVNAGYDASGSSYSNFIGSGAGYGAINTSQSNFIGPSSGFFSTGVTQSFFVGYEAGRQSVNLNYSNVFGYQAGYGVTSATYVNFLGNQSGYQATSAQFSNFIGYAAGTSATNAQYSNFIGANAGLQASNASYSTLIGFNAGKFFTNNNIGSNNIIIGTNISLPSGTTNSLNIGGVLFGTGLYSTTGGNPLTTANAGKIGINVVSPTNTLDIGGSLLVTGSTYLGNGTFTKAGNAAGDVLLDNSSTDTPGVLFYYANNSNYGIDSWSGSFDVLSGQLVRVTNKLNETGGAVKMAIDTSGNMVVTGFIKPSAWRAGQVVNDIMLSNTEVTISTTTIATSTSDTDFLTYSYTPLSSSSYIVIHYHLASFSFEGGSGNDSYFSRIKVDGTEITYSRQSTVNGNRTGVLFPLTGRYTNSNTTAKSIVVACRRDSADDNITIVNTATSMWLRITEIAR